MALTVLLCVCVLFGCSSATDVHFYVSPTGSDTSNGTTVQFPLKTIAKAVYFATRPTFTASDNLYIELLQGYHELESTLNINQHHGQLLTIRSYKGQEVHVAGGRSIPLNNFHSVSDGGILNALPRAARRFVKFINLPNLNITNYGPMQQYGFHAYKSAPLEVFYNGQPFRMAQWPNDGYINIVGTPDGSKGLRVQYNSTRPSTWRYLDDIWLYGFWSRGWADKSAKMASIDTKTMIITMDNSTRGLLGVRTGQWGTQTGTDGGYFRFMNVLSELDQPGEYFLDRKTGNLYVWMPASTRVMQVSLVKTCISLNGGVKNMVLSNFIVENCRERGVYMNNGRNIQLINMEVRNTGDYAINIGGDSRSCSVIKSVIHDSDGAIAIFGGNRARLESGMNVVEDCEIYNFNRVSTIGKDAIQLRGDGNAIRYNTIWDGSASAVRYYGNDHTIEYNNIHRVCVNVSYCGAIYSDNDWTYRGLTIRYNHIHDILRNAPGSSVYGIMLNHQVSSATVTHNVLFNNEIHILLDAGRDNIVTQNMLYNATKYSVHVAGRNNPNSYLMKTLRAMPYNGTLWKARYPKLANSNIDNMTLPEGNLIQTNLIFTDHKPYISGMNGWLDDPAYFNVTTTGFSFGPEDHFNPTIGDLRLRCHAVTWANTVNFEQVLSPNEVGPRSDIGPSFSKSVHKTVQLSVPTDKCVAFYEPAKESPMPSYNPDGSGQTPVYKTFDEGCWLHVDKCTKDPKAAGTYRDMNGERFFNAADNETMCFKRALEQWKFCGSNPNEMVAAIYGPTGSMTYGGFGCLLSWYGCPKRNGPADGHVVPGKVNHDTSAENIRNASLDEESCLKRAIDVWTWCGSHSNHTVTSIFLTTGSRRTAGDGCWIETKACPEKPSNLTMFYDAFGATNSHSDEYQTACFGRAKDYWTSCGSVNRYPVTAHFRPTTNSFTYP